MNAIFTEEQMSRPLFENPTCAQNLSGSPGGRAGFIVGGKANLTFNRIGQQFFDAAYVLSETIRIGEWEDHRLAYPILFLYRHSIEVLLKSAVGTVAKTHDLETLSGEFRALIKAEFDADLPSWIISRLRELSEIDPSSTAFRYSRNFDRTTRTDVPVNGEFHVDLSHLQSAMTALNTALVGAIAAIACGEGNSARGIKTDEER